MKTRTKICSARLALQPCGTSTATRFWRRGKNPRRWKSRRAGARALRYHAGTNLVPLDPDVCKAFRSERAVNLALRLVIELRRVGSHKRRDSSSKRRLRSCGPPFIEVATVNSSLELTVGSSLKQKPTVTKAVTVATRYQLPGSGKMFPPFR